MTCLTSEDTRQALINRVLHVMSLMVFAVASLAFLTSTAHAQVTSAATTRDLNRRFLLENLSVQVKTTLGTQEEQAASMGKRGHSAWAFDAQRRLTAWASQKHPSDVTEHLVLLSFIDQEGQRSIMRMTPAVIENGLEELAQESNRLTPIEAVRLWNLSFALQSGKKINELKFLERVQGWLEEDQPSLLDHAILMDQVNKLHRGKRVSPEVYQTIGEQFITRCATVVSTDKEGLSESIYYCIFLTMYASSGHATDVMKHATSSIIDQSMENLPALSFVQMHELGFLAELPRMWKKDGFVPRHEVYHKWFIQHSGKWDLTLAQASYLMITLDAHGLGDQVASARSEMIKEIWQRIKDVPLTLTMSDLSSLKEFSVKVAHDMPERASFVDLELAQMLKTRFSPDVIGQDHQWLSLAKELKDYDLGAQNIDDLATQWLRHPRDWSRYSFYELADWLEAFKLYHAMPESQNHVDMIVDQMCRQMETVLEVSEKSVTGVQHAMENVNDHHADRLRQILLKKIQASLRQEVVVDKSLHEYITSFRQRVKWLTRFGGSLDSDDSLQGLSKWVEVSDVFQPYDAEKLVSLDAGYRYYATTTAPYRRIIRDMGSGAGEKMQQKIVQGEISPKPALLMMLTWHFRDKSWARFNQWKDYVQERFDSSTPGSQDRLMWGLGLAYVQELSIYEPAPTLGTPLIRQLISEFDDAQVRFNLTNVIFMQTLGSGQHDRAESIARAYAQETQNKQYKEVFLDLANGVAKAKATDLAHAARTAQSGERRRVVGRIKALEKKWHEAQLRGDERQASTLAGMIDEMKSQIK